MFSHASLQQAKVNLDPVICSTNPPPPAVEIYGVHYYNCGSQQVVVRTHRVSTTTQNRLSPSVTWQILIPGMDGWIGWVEEGQKVKQTVVQHRSLFPEEKHIKTLFYPTSSFFLILAHPLLSVHYGIYFTFLQILS